MATIDFRTVSKEMPIFSTNLSEHVDALRLAAEAILEQQRQNPQSMKSNVYAHYVSDYSSHLHNPKFQPLTDLVVSFCEEVSRTYFKCDLKYKCYNCWGMLYQAGDHAIKHNHFPSTFAAVVYLDVEPGSAPIEFENQLQVVPTRGSLLVFPAELDHVVPPTQGKRMVVAMNIDHVS